MGILVHFDRQQAPNHIHYLQSWRERERETLLVAGGFYQVYDSEFDQATATISAEQHMTCFGSWRGTSKEEKERNRTVPPAPNKIDNASFYAISEDAAQSLRRIRVGSGRLGPRVSKKTL